GGRALGMGGSYVAIADDATSVYWNPAGLASLSRPAASLMHSSLYGLDSYDFISIAYPAGGGSVGAGWLRVGVDEIMYTEVPKSFMPPGVLNRPYVVDTFSTSYNLFSISYGFKAWGGVMAGLSVKGVYIDTLWGVNAWGIGLDLGALYRRGRLSLGAAVQDLTKTKLFWNTPPEEGTSHTDVMSPNLRVGVAYSVEIERLKSRLTLSAEANSIYSFEKRAGVEWNIGDVISLRFGLQERKGLERRTDFTAGAGLKIKFVSGGGIDIDYAFLSSELGNCNRISLNIKI
ncbi:hypothetical protein DRP77_12610, partial [Candidatus Poribacteria bacterium]